jgi:serine acetyltransferase
MPGVKIGAGSFIGAGVTVSEDIPENKFVVMGKTSLAMSDNTKSASSSRDEFRKAI